MKRLGFIAFIVLSLSGVCFSESAVSGKVYAEAVFAQHCFWTGEMKLGAIEGVKRTEAGFFGGSEVTRVWYDPSVIAFQELFEKAKSLDLADRVFLAPSSEASVGSTIAPLERFEESGYRRAPSSDQKRQLRGTVFSSIAMSEAQKTKVNAFARQNKSKAMSYLSDAQRAKIDKLTIP